MAVERESLDSGSDKSGQPQSEMSPAAKLKKLELQLRNAETSRKIAEGNLKDAEKQIQELQGKLKAYDEINNKLIERLARR